MIGINCIARVVRKSQMKMQLRCVERVDRSHVQLIVITLIFRVKANACFIEIFFEFLIPEIYKD